MEDFLSTARALHHKGELFDRSRSVFIARSPGRLDLMGGNDDYTGGMVFEATIREATWAAAQTRTDRKVVLVNPQVAEHNWQPRVECALEELTDEATTRAIVNRSPQVRWSAYVLGVIYYLHRRAAKQLETGVTVYLESDVPLGKGVSSSAAVEVAVMKAVASAYGAPLSGVALAEACQWVENVIAESACGIMDQIAVVLGDEGHVLPLVCQPCLPQPLVRLPQELSCWAVDSGVTHAVTGIEYEAARAGAFMGYKLICDAAGLTVREDRDSAIPRFTDDRFGGYLANLSPAEYRARYEHPLPERMTGAEFLAKAHAHVDPFTPARPEASYAVRACTRYAVEENLRVRLFASLAAGAIGDNLAPAARLMGELMYQSHHGYTETELGNAATDRLVALAREEGPERGIYGAKVTGGGAGGTIAILGAASAEPAFARIVERYAAETGRAPYVFRGSSQGADRFGVIEITSG
jgi:galactokinase